MLYREYETFKIKFYETQEQYNQILNEKEELFVMTQPKGTSFEKELVDGSNPSNIFDNYLILKEKRKIDQRLDEIRALLDDRGKLLRLKEEELKSSNDIQDMVYKYRYLEKLKINKICRLVGYERAQIFRILKIIKNNLK